MQTEYNISIVHSVNYSEWYVYVVVINLSILDITSYVKHLCYGFMFVWL